MFLRSMFAALALLALAAPAQADTELWPPVTADRATFEVDGIAVTFHGDGAGCPSTGSWAAGDVAIGTDGAWCVCIAGGSPGSWYEAASAGALASTSSGLGASLVGVEDLAGATACTDAECWLAELAAAIGGAGAAQAPIFSCANSDETFKTANTTAYVCRFSFDKADFSGYTNLAWEAGISATAATADCEFAVDSGVSIGDAAAVSVISVTDADDSMVDTSSPKLFEVLTGTVALSGLASGVKTYAVGSTRTGSSGGCTVFYFRAWAE